METYTILREFADSWWLIAMTLFFIGVSLYTLRPGTREQHRDIAMTPMRNDTLPRPQPGDAEEADTSAPPTDKEERA
ncbi:MAG: cbb3-type cytochrome c oxidase subunit 3 [Pseudomonadota bacterium]